MELLTTILKYSIVTLILTTFICTASAGTVFGETSESLSSKDISTSTIDFVSSKVTTVLPTTTSGTHNGTNGTDSSPVYVGFIASAVSVVLFGSNFVPVKKFETGDGMFFQWVLCTFIWLVGLIVNAVRGFPTFYPLAMLGGFLWATGNITVVPIVKTIGLGLGLCVWATFNLLAGWSSGRFGWFGMTPRPPNNEAMNYAGAALAAVSGIVYLFVQSEGGGPSDKDKLVENPETEPLLRISSPSIINDPNRVLIDDPNSRLPFYERLPPTPKRLLGFGMAIFAGILYGLNFTPVIYIQDHSGVPGPYHGASQNGLDYVFAHYSGIYTTSITYFVIYAVFKKNKPDVYPQAILPAAFSGTLWAIAGTAWFIANQILSEPISFPIITTGPGVIAALWGVFVFKEIKGRRNILILLLAFTFVVTGTVLCGLSKL